MSTLDTEFHEPPPKSFASEGAAIHAAPNSQLALASLILGVLSYVALPVIGALGAVVTGHLALGHIRASAGRMGGAPLAKIGLVLGYAQLVALVIVA
ncbi:MAG: DUF4190 domain-containing protein, partial [Isosphaeraceae bacterium]|nr:DUF4190 domain-containing protein [Isosphaeraceae bacterium]